MKLDFTEFNKLVQMVEEIGIPHTVCEMFGGKQIKIYADDLKTQLLDDAIIHNGSYGREKGLLESYNAGNCQGYETADEIFTQWKRMFKRQSQKVKGAKIVEVEENLIRFSDGTEITGYHEQDCCEDNYADCGQLDDIALNTEFDTSNLVFEEVEGSGFRFGNAPSKMFFVPCYSSQNGYYSSDIEIRLNGEQMLYMECPMI